MIHRTGSLPPGQRLAFAAGVIRASGLPAYTHLLGRRELEALWDLACQTVPVIHNAPGGWNIDPGLFETDHVPFVAACGEKVAAALGNTGLRKPVRVLRHVVPERARMPAELRERLRRAFGVREGQCLIGMIGRFAPQKNHKFALRILLEVRRRGRDARLAIVGGTEDAKGAACRRDVDLIARALGMRDHVVMPGPVHDAGAISAVFDVLLNTSTFEGVSIATMEAVASGVPVVSADVGGQCEAIGPEDALLPLDAGLDRWAAAIESALNRSDGPRQPGDRRVRHAASHLWPWMLAVGPGAAGIHARPRERRAGLLFATGNLDVGGAQRSLCNLAAALASRGISVVVAVAGAFGVPGFMADARRAGVEFLDLAAVKSNTWGLHARAGKILALVCEYAPRTLVFWNMDAATKLVVAKAMEGGRIRLADVSPGPAFFRELDTEAQLARSLALRPGAYLASLDVLVVKYRNGLSGLQDDAPRRCVIIPNGVPEPDFQLADGEGPAPPHGADPALAVVTVGRLVRAKRPELLPLVARALDELLPGATLTVVGGLHKDGETWAKLFGCDRCALPHNLHFAGPDYRTLSFLDRFFCFYMISIDQGCPNASLEAMSAGLPVVANPDGGTAEQVIDGVTGLLIADPGCARSYARSLAAALASVLRDPPRARAMGLAGQNHVRTMFSMAAMADAYAAVLLSAEGGDDVDAVA